MAKITLKAPDLQVADGDDKIYFRFTLNAEASLVIYIYSIGVIMPTIGVIMPTLVRILICGTLEAGDYSSRQKAVLWDRISGPYLPTEPHTRQSAGFYMMEAVLDGSTSVLTSVKFELD